jgi:excisionase family DNA binding protein
VSQAGKPMATPAGAVPISELESVSQAAQRIGISPAYVYRMIRKSRLPAWEVAGKLVVRKADVDQLRKAS